MFVAPNGAECARFHLAGVTMHESAHFTALIRWKEEGFFLYDGMIHAPPRRIASATELHASQKLQWAIYLRLPMKSQ